MQVREKGGVYGEYRFFSIDPITKHRKPIGVKKNLIMDDTLNYIAKTFIGVYPTQCVVKRCCIGDDNTTPTAADEDLVSTVLCMEYISRSNPSNGVALLEFYIGRDDYVGDIEEVGIFGGFNSAILLSRVLWSYTKSDAEEILIQYTITFSRA
jgi:hypothetical protein